MKGRWVVWHDVWSADHALYRAFPGLYCIVVNQDISVSDLLAFSNGSHQWDVHDWEMDTVSEFFIHIYSTGGLMVHGDRMQWRPNWGANDL